MRVRVITHTLPLPPPEAGVTAADEANDEDLSAAGVGLFAGVERLEKKEPMMPLVTEAPLILHVAEAYVVSELWEVEGRPLCRPKCSDRMASVPPKPNGGP